MKSTTNQVICGYDFILFFFSKLFEPTLNKSPELWLILNPGASSSSTTTMTYTKQQQQQQLTPPPHNNNNQTINLRFNGGFFSPFLILLYTFSFSYDHHLNDDDPQVTQHIEMAIGATAAAAWARDMTHLEPTGILYIYIICFITLIFF